jgi:uncharacterized protein YdhG (YjbR/CyaY superfamily)
LLVISARMKKSKSDKRSPVTKSRGVRKGQRKKQEKTTAPTAANKSALKRLAAKTKAAPKGKTAPLTVDAYLAAVPEPARSAMDQIREAIRSIVPPETTEIISYKIPAFKHKKVLVWYAAFSNHCSLFPTAAVIEEFKDELKDFSTSKGTIHFPLDKPMPVELIKKMVKERLGRSG